MTFIRILVVRVLHALAGAALAAAPGAAMNSGGRYVLDVRFNPDDGALAVSGTLSIVSRDGLDTLELLLNGGLFVERLQPDRVATVAIENGITIDSDALPNTQRITVTPEQPLAAGERMAITLACAGRVTPTASRSAAAS